MRERAALEREVAMLLGQGPLAGARASNPVPSGDRSAEMARRDVRTWASPDGRDLEVPTPADRATFALIATRIATLQKSGTVRDVPVLRRMQALGSAVLAEDQDASRRAVKALLDEPGTRTVSAATESVLGPVAGELVARCYVLGLTNESKTLTDYFASGTSYLPAMSRPAPARAGWAFDTIIAHLQSRPAPADGGAARARLDVLARVFGNLAREFAGVYAGVATAWEPGLQALLEAMFAALEVMVHGVTKELESGSSTAAASLAAARRTLIGVMNLVLPRYEAVPLRVDVTRTARTPKPRHVDYFDAARGPSVPVTAYSRVTPTFTDKALSIHRVFEIRGEQLAALEVIFGQATRLKMKLALHDNESWRAFATAIVKRARAAGKAPADALGDAVDLLSRYVRTFTLHTPVNIDDFGTLPVATALRENYLERTFPRAATGQRIHDCGVYTVRVAYILSGARELLDFSERAILLPVHVGLVITLGKLDTLEHLATARALLVHNDRLEMIAQPVTLARSWADGRPYDETKFLAALSGSRYIRGVPLPFRFEPVPVLRTATPAGARRAALWKWYLTAVTPRLVPLVLDVLKPTPAIREPWLEYLRAFELDRRNSNDGLVPFWRQATALWNGMDHGRWLALVKDLLRQGAAGRERFKKAVAPVWMDYWKLSQGWRETMEDLADARSRILTFLVDHPTALERGARPIEGADALSASTAHETGFWWYLGDLPSKVDRLQKDPAIALRRAQALGKSSLVTGTGGSGLTPPWVALAPPEPMD